MNGAWMSNLNPANQNNRTTRDDHDWPHDLNADSMGFYESFYEGRSRFVHDSTVMHQFSQVAGNRPGAGMGTVSMMHQSPICQRNNVRRPSISTEYQEDLLLGPAGCVTRNARNAVQTANQLLAPDQQFFRFNHLVAPLSQQPPDLLQEPAANGNNGALFPAGMIVASPNSDQMPLVRPNDMPMAAAPEGQTADHSAEHQVMIDRLIAQIQRALRRLGRQSDAFDFEYNSQLNFSEDDDDIDDEDQDDGDNEDDNMSLDIDDLSLDLDNMSYEAHLELEQDMGTGSSQFHEDVIQAKIQQHKYQPIEEAEGDRNLCCICLEEYAAGDNIGKLDNCVHVYHVTCITLWLELQNSCPVCKALALAALA